MDELIIEQWKDRKIKANKIFQIQEIDKIEGYEFVRKYHYLGDAKFFAKYSYGLFYKDELVGVATYSNPQGNVALMGWFGLPNTDQSVLELSRLCLLPKLNGTNASSYLLGNSIKQLKKKSIRAVITLADSSRHIGSIYQVCNFKYYGLSNQKSDFYRYPDHKKNPRGKTSEWHGVWLKRTQKHRYAYILDQSLKCLYDELPHPIEKTTIDKECCHGTGFVVDGRFGEIYECPICKKDFRQVSKTEWLYKLLA